MRVTSKRFPWYDSNWLSHFVEAQHAIRAACPERLDEFLHAFDVLRTPTSFRVTKLSRVYDGAIMDQIKDAVLSFKPTDLEVHEIKRFGRFVVHDLPLFHELQREVVPLMNKIVNEEVEPSYNFLSIYTKLGVCAVHMDAPSAKWTLDLCIDQSGPWPIHFSDVQQWPVDYQPGEPWEDTVRHDAAPFTAYTLEPGEAVVFSGSSQWHYREPLPLDGREHRCELLFLHFIPKGTRQLVEPSSWSDFFGIPELAAIE